MTPGEPITLRPAEDRNPVAKDTSAAASAAFRTESTLENKNEAKRKFPLASIPTIISIGLLVAALYLGGRILSARRSAKPAAVVSRAATTAVIPPVPAPRKEIALGKEIAPKEPPPAISQPAQLLTAKAVEKPPKPTPAETTSAAQDEADSVATITPQHGQLYIQVGALDTDAEATRRFVERLRGEKMDPHIAPSPNPVLVRVLIGPFDNLESLNEKKAQLQNEGVDTFVRKY